MSTDAPKTPKKLMEADSADIITDEKALARHEARMKYAWNWFQYHADQRIKSFNYFVIVIGFLVAAYATAVKEAYPGIAAAAAFSGTVIALAFCIIDIRNTELVNCGRQWLDFLEKQLMMSIREYDATRYCLPEAAPGWLIRWVLPPCVIKHQFAFRAIYVISAILFAAGFVFAVSRIVCMC